GNRRMKDETAKAATFRPPGWPAVIPRIFTPHVIGLVTFLKEVFGAEGEARAGTPAEMRLGDSIIMVSDGGGVRGARPAFLYVYVADTNNTYSKAIAAGANTIEEPVDTPYGDRRATVEDPWGNIWQIATYGPQSG